MLVGHESHISQSKDKQFETKKVSGCPRASRNSIIHRYLIYRRSVCKLSADLKRKQVKAAHTNVR